MPDINPETACFLISKLHEFQVKDEVEIPDMPGDPTTDWAQQVMAEHMDDYCFLEIASAINDLDPVQQATLVALMWVGRGDFEVEEWDEALREAKGAWNPHTAAYLAATPMAADYLDEGLSLFGYSCQD